VAAGHLPPLPKTIDFTVDYLRAGQARDCFARARVNRSGRRYASVHAEAWQESPDKPFASAVVHFLMPETEG
jgi:acyl-coenzyme A thioesterase PaaI-like protein